MKPVKNEKNFSSTIFLDVYSLNATNIFNVHAFLYGICK